MGEPIHLGYAILKLSKLLVCEKYYEQLQTFCGRGNVQLHYIECDSFVLSFRTQNIINDFKSLEGLLDVGNLDTNHE